MKVHPPQISINRNRLSVTYHVGRPFDIDHGREPLGYCRRVAVATSLDAKLWVDRHAAPGTRRVTILSMPSVALARYIRLKAVQPSARPWAIAELYVQ